MDTISTHSRRGPTRVRVGLFHGPGSGLELVYQPLPELEPGGLRVRVTCCTLCGSDLHTYAGHREAQTPLVLGHEIVGTIHELGSGAPRDHLGQPLTEGQRVTWSIAASCGACSPCKNGLPQKCDSLFKYGHEPHDPQAGPAGGLAEFCDLRPGTAVIPVPATVSDPLAAMSSCALATAQAALRAGKVQAGDVVVVFGAGALGLSASAMARAHGAGAVLVVEPDASRRELASRFGATEVLDTENAVAQLMERTAGRGADLSLELAGSTQAATASLDCLRVGGRAVLAGTVSPTQPLELDPEQLVRRMLQVQGQHNYTPEDLVRALEFLEQHGNSYPFEELICATFPLERAEEAFEQAATGAGLRVAVSPGTDGA